jgi:imidazole glycerol-phosphate synthase subunit HisH
MTLALIDYGAGNLQSVKNALKAAGAADVAVTADPTGLCCLALAHLRIA